MKLMPTSAALTAVVKQTSDSEPIATNARVALKLPPALASLNDPKYKNLSHSDFQEACESPISKPVSYYDITRIDEFQKTTFTCNKLISYSSTPTFG